MRPGDIEIPAYDEEAFEEARRVDAEMAAREAARRPDWRRLVRAANPVASGDEPANVVVSGRQLANAPVVGPLVAAAAAMVPEEGESFGGPSEWTERVARALNRETSLSARSAFEGAAERLAAPLGGLDEMRAATEAAIMEPRGAVAAHVPFGDEAEAERYEAARQRALPAYRERRDMVRAEAPVSHAMGQAGGMALSMAPMARLSAGASVPASLARGAGVSTAASLGEIIDQRDYVSADQRAEGLGSDAALAALYGTGGELVGQGAARGLAAAGRGVANWASRDGRTFALRHIGGLSPGDIVELENLFGSREALNRAIDQVGLGEHVRVGRFDMEGFLRAVADVQRPGALAARDAAGRGLDQAVDAGVEAARASRMAQPAIPLGPPRPRGPVSQGTMLPPATTAAAQVPPPPPLPPPPQVTDEALPLSRFERIFVPQDSAGREQVLAQLGTPTAPPPSRAVRQMGLAGMGQQPPTPYGYPLQDAPPPPASGPRAPAPDDPSQLGIRFPARRTHNRPLSHEERLAMLHLAGDPRVPPPSRSALQSLQARGMLGDVGDRQWSTTGGDLTATGRRAQPGVATWARRATDVDLTDAPVTPRQAPPPEPRELPSARDFQAPPAPLEEPRAWTVDDVRRAMRATTSGPMRTSVGTPHIGAGPTTALLEQTVGEFDRAFPSGRIPFEDAGESLRRARSAARATYTDTDRAHMADPSNVRDFLRNVRSGMLDRGRAIDPTLTKQWEDSQAMLALLNRLDPRELGDYLRDVPTAAGFAATAAPSAPRALLGATGIMAARILGRDLPVVAGLGAEGMAAGARRLAAGGDAAARAHALARPAITAGAGQLVSPAGAEEAAAPLEPQPWSEDVPAGDVVDVPPTGGVDFENEEDFINSL